MKKRILSLLLALVLCSALVLPVLADAYIPPEKTSPYYDITTAHNYNGNCNVLNTFLSNFAEIGLAEYNESSPEEVAIAAVLKHLEINAKFYSDSVKKVDGDDSRTYMRVKGSFFERRMDRLFGLDIPASACPGYEDGKILVTAEHFGGPIQVFASVTHCEAVSDDLYRAWFDVYRVDKDFSGWYRTASQNLPLDNLTRLGTGEALVHYDGHHTVDSIATSDFYLAELSMEAEGIPCAGPNLPYGVEETEPPTEETAEETTQETTAESTEEATQETTQAATVTMTEPQTEPETEPETMPEKIPEKEAASGMGTGTLLLIIALVLITALLSLIIILLLFKKK